MKLRFDRNGTVFEYEKKPMPDGRFKALCAIACLLAYIGVVAVDRNGTISKLSILLFGGVCAGILLQGTFKDL